MYVNVVKVIFNIISLSQTQYKYKHFLEEKYFFNLINYIIFITLLELISYFNFIIILLLSTY